MKKRPVFVSLVETRPLLGCEVVDPQDTAGAIIRCYMVAPDARSAEALMRSTLADDHFEIVNVEFCVNYDDTDWENPHDIEANECVNDARDSMQVVYGRIDVWGHEEN